MRRRDCYIIEQGCTYEGGGVVAVSLDYEKAIEYSLKLVEKEQKEDERHREYALKSHIEFVLKDPERYDIKDPENYKGEDYKHVTEDWTEDGHAESSGVEGKYWTNGMDYISIVKQELI
jgi:hypothetical protein